MDFVKDLFNGGTGVITGHAPDVNSWDYPDGVSVDDFGVYTPPVPNPAPTNYKLDGAGALGFDPSGYVGTSVSSVLKVHTPPTGADLFAETIVRADPDDASLTLMWLARASDSLDWAGAVRGIGGGIQFGTFTKAATIYSYGGSFGVGSTFPVASYSGAGLTTFTARLELEGNARRIYINSELVVTDNVLSYGTFPSAGDLYFIARWRPQTVSGDGMYQPRILSLRAGDLPEDNSFWTNKVKCSEVDS